MSAADLIARLRDVAQHDWRVSFLAHTSDTAREAADTLSTAIQERDALQRENDAFRATTANGPGPCVYCALPRERWAECNSGFPGCGRGDDAMLCPHVGSDMGLRDELATAIQERDQARADAFEEALAAAVGYRPEDDPAVKDAPDWDMARSEIIARIRASLSQEPGRSEAMDGEGGR